MKNSLINSYLLVALLAVPGTLTSNAMSQSAESAANPAVSAPVAYVYVSSAFGSANKISGYAAAASGTLSAVAGSPFNASVVDMATNGKYLFGNGTDDASIYTFSMLSGGALKLVQTTNTQSGTSASGCTGLRYPVLDHTGSTLYELTFNGGLCEGSSITPFAIDNPTGKLTALASTTPETDFYSPIKFTANNEFAYGASCNYYRTGNIPYLLGFKRNSAGELMQVLDDYNSVPLPTNEFYCPYLAVSDTKNHVVVSMQEIDSSTFSPIGPQRLAVFTSDGSGNLTTTSTAANMTSTDVGYINDMAMSPAGGVLAVAGVNGVELFYFNGTAPMKYFTRIVPNESINELQWDNAGHLYALSQSSGNLYVYNVTSRSVTNAPGSPFNNQGSLGLTLKTLTSGSKI